MVKNLALLFRQLDFDPSYSRICTCSMEHGAWSKDKAVLVMEMEVKLIVDWLRKSGMKVNKSKTELCLFHGGTHCQLM